MERYAVVCKLPTGTLEKTIKALEGADNIPLWYPFMIHEEREALFGVPCFDPSYSEIKIDYNWVFPKELCHELIKEEYDCFVTLWKEDHKDA